MQCLTDLLIFDCPLLLLLLWLWLEALMVKCQVAVQQRWKLQIFCFDQRIIIWVIFTTPSTRYHSQSMLDCVCIGQSALNFLSVSVENLWYFRSFRSTYCARKLSMLQIFRFYLWFNIWDWKSKVRQTVDSVIFAHSLR